MSKKIKSCAIVPEELYVIRRADIQLEQIIADMGRPGYVLVSRQMGKTNLLLNAKRNFDSPDDCFAYLDVSNTFNDLRDFFRNIIDSIILSRDCLVVSLLAEIGQSRLGTANLQPHKEHEFELKKVLDSLPGNLVVCLDEIDALTGVDYSDNVFSLIRSIYFGGRTQFPQFKRLTYVLSGVADPAELIKNKSVSPFNIGEKIYLEDFTRPETERFLLQCDLHLPDEVIDRIYHWTSGNPRVTWDLCSAAENMRDAGGLLDSFAIDSIVTSLYLTNYDLPPFDHIRTRVQSDKELRNAVMAIHYGKTTSLSDKVKDRLYLAGISTPKLESGEVKFKNKIVAESLSEKWISDTEIGLLSLDDRAGEKLKLGRYDEALKLYREFFILNITAESKLATQLNIGLCLVQLGDIPAAISEYESIELEGVSSIQWITAKHHWAGICYLFSKEFAKAELEFRKILSAASAPQKENFYPEACINLASVLMARAQSVSEDNAAIMEEAESLLLSAVELIENQSSGSGSQGNAIIYTAYYQLSRSYSLSGEIEKARGCLDKALGYSDVDVRSTFLYERAHYEISDIKQAEYYQRCAKNIVENKLSISGKDVLNNLKFDVDECSLLITKLASFGQFSDAHALFEYVCSTGEKQGIDSWKVIVGSMTSAIEEGSLSLLPDLAKISLKSNSFDLSELRHVITIGIIVRAEPLPDRDKQLFLAYIYKVLSDDKINLLEADFRVIFDVFNDLFSVEDYELCSELLKFAEQAFERTVDSKELSSEVFGSGSLVLLLLRMKLNIRLDRAEEMPDKLMPFIHNIWFAEDFALSHFPDDFASNLDATFRKLIDHKFYEAKPNNFVGGAEDFSGISQNSVVTVQYSNGKVCTAKFKKFKSDLEKGICKITN
ncbi:AAA-like domain-containing protein [Pseudomonas saxonica]|uniref:AAA-like domain-containing protein n=1 Tax=Pseudomonas saxonica TaxID=2600598 RepID=UPI002D76C80C|nr:AAA-like domain-containing protein [Pseudomonas saxonica]WRQ75035.1 AAA-like domain-containing protein [Pseudomonas saxonica]